MTQLPSTVVDPENQADGGDNRIPKRSDPPETDSAARSREARERLDTNRAKPAHDAAVLGPTMVRYDGREKVLGTASYADDVPLGAATYAYAVTSPVARGRIRSVDTHAAEGLAGVLRVYTHAAMSGQLKPARFVGQGGQATSDLAVMCGPEIAYAGQIIGLVVAESFETAREAAHLVRYDIEEQPWAATFDDPGLRVRPVAEIDPNWHDPAVGNAEAAFASAPLSIEANYSTPPQHHNPIELFSTSCWWEDDRLIIHEPSAGVAVLQIGVATQLGIPPDRIDVISPYVGGSFGAKVNTTPRTALVAIASRDLGRPVRLVLTRTQGFTQSTHRGETRHTVHLACDRSGRMLAYRHWATEVSSRTDAYTVKGTSVSVHMYGWAHADTRVEVAEADRNTPGFMRAPAEMPYMFALECAVDELAEKAGIDPVEFRRINDVRTTAYQGKSFTSRSLVECLDAGAAAFGWSKRDARPRSMGQGDWQVGYGMAAACHTTSFSVTAARVRVTADGHATVEIGAHDIGTGAYGAAAMVAAQELGIEVTAVRVRLGDSRLPMGPVAGSSRITATMCNAIAETCHALRVRLGVADGASILSAVQRRGAIEESIAWNYPGAGPEAAATFFKGGQAPAGGVEGDKLRMAFGAVFVELHVHRRTREIRLARVTGAFAAGRIINARTAHSQLMGGLIWGVGFALHEATDIDRRYARYTNDSTGEYLVPVNADIPGVEVIMIPEDDREVNALGIKGIGELGNVGTAAAVCNAIFHATGRRVRDLPVTLDKLL